MMKQEPVTLYIVVPCYNEEDVLPESCRRLNEVLGNLVSRGSATSESRILFVNDGSKDSTWELIQRYHAGEETVCGVNLAANAGHQNALMAGLETALPHADAIVTIDADLQDDVTAIGLMVDKFREGCDIVYGVRRERKTDSWFKRTTALAFYKVMRKLGVKSVYNHADFRLMSRRAAEQLLSYRERNLFLRGIVPLIGYRTDKVYYDRDKRFAGESKYPLGKMIGFAADGITSFSIKPIRALMLLGAIFIVISLGILIYALTALFTHTTVSGWTSLILSLWFIGGCILVGLGIVGEYIGKIYLEVKDRPRYNIETTLLK